MSFETFAVTSAPPAERPITGRHDDLVLAVAIALWWTTERRKHRVIVGPVLGLY